jgi:hypothetical protein
MKKNRATETGITSLRWFSQLSGHTKQGKFVLPICVLRKSKRV